MAGLLSCILIQTINNSLKWDFNWEKHTFILVHSKIIGSASALCRSRAQVHMRDFESSFQIIIKMRSFYFNFTIILVSKYQYIWHP